MSLTIEHLAPYAPYRLKAMLGNGEIAEITGVYWGDKWCRCDIIVGTQNGSCNIDLLKPILRPMSDLTRDIEHNGEIFVPMDRLKTTGTSLNEIFWRDKIAVASDNEGHELEYDTEYMSFFSSYKRESRVCRNQYEKFQCLLSWHFDVFGLIEKGLAIA